MIDNFVNPFSGGGLDSHISAAGTHPATATQGIRPAQSEGNWYNYPIPTGGSHAAGDDGDDLDTPDKTPVWFPFGGHVLDARWYVYGGQVVASVPGTDYSEYFIHLDDIYVHPGQDIPPGTVIGTTGGGVGDKVLHNGVVQPAQDQSWYQGHSTGYHTELGFFQGSDMPSFNQGWGDSARQLDPTPVIEELRHQQEPVWPGPGTPSGGTTGGNNPVSGILSNLFPWLSSSPLQARWHLISWGVGLAGVASIGFGMLFLYSAVKGEGVIQIVNQLPSQVTAAAGALGGKAGGAAAGGKAGAAAGGAAEGASAGAAAGGAAELAALA